MGLPIRLRTADGGAVAEAEIPPFQTPPEVIVWASRVFALKLPPADDGAIVYREVFAFHVTNWEASATK